eukprot:TRINITY_DN7656_c0_g1_i2.p1 TRINITY_DN7656_c0_g1~~TRINITY_DN7656_c0_g1_i2.p1  ORF type:complete len:241 (-),score=87.72 TRINITY_DN7656_c0_g1_i2:511-1140(-)
MGGGGIAMIVAFFIAVGTANILPSLHHSDMFEIRVDAEDDTSAKTDTELDEFEIFGGFGYSSSLSDFGVPVVYKDAVNLQIIDENDSKIAENQDTFDGKRHDMEYENVGEQEMYQEDGMIDTPIEIGDQNEDERHEAIYSEVTEEEFNHESVLLEGNPETPPASNEELGNQVDNLDGIKMPESKDEYKEETSAEHQDSKYDDESIIGKG